MYARYDYGSRVAEPSPFESTGHGERLSLTPGTRLGPYEILSPLGAGAGAIYGIKRSFLFTGPRQHPRFTALMKKMNLA
ncbi:MAG TPA: hypothetical protein VGG65_06120 [Thermoanaerobaculia bacterium]